MHTARGTIFSIEEFSTFDGPGIRATVFLKGCPLRCVWCHNPEGQRFVPEVVRSPNGCLNCGACLAAGKAATGTPTLTEESIPVCPRHLVRRCGEELDADALCRRLAKNAALLNAADGGVTFSGGEPLAQPDFLLAALRGLDGVTHRAIQTTGFTAPEVFRQVLEHCDYVLYDLKLMDSAAHRHYTGVPNETILQNFRTLAGSGKPLTVRIPLIPAVNDTAENLTATARFLRENGIDKVEMLPYNRMAGGKYAMLGRQYTPGFDESAEPQPHKELFTEYGIEVDIL